MNARQAIYLDHAATTPVREEVVAAMLPFLREHFGNAASLHRFGRRARRAVENAREQVAALINAAPREIVFTSGASEANHWVLRHASQLGKRVWVGATEHPSILGALTDRELLSVDDEGRVDASEVWENSGEDVLIGLMHGNNETGTVHPIEELVDGCRGRGAWVHVDAVQSVAYLPMDVRRMGMDFLTVSAHKLHGPKGVGALYMRSGLALTEPGPQSQAEGWRMGTENVAAIVGFGEACDWVRKERDSECRRLSALRDSLQEGLLQGGLDGWVNGATETRLPHLLNMGFASVEGEALMYGLDAEGIAVSTGAACTSGSSEASHVLLAMGQSHAQAHRAIRFSLGRCSRPDQLAPVIAAVRKLAGVS